MVNNSTAVSTIHDDFDSNIPAALQILLGFIIIVTMVISICGNFVVCYLVYRKPSMRSAINILLAHIALSDILLSVFVMPFAFVTLITKNWILTDMCNLLGFLQAFFVGVGVFVLLAISADRFLIISQRREKLNLSRARILLIVIWCFNALLALPPVFGWTNYHFQSGLIFCVPAAEMTLSDLFYVCLFAILAFYLPILLMLCTFACILDIVRKNGMRVQQHAATGSVLSHRNSSYFTSNGNFQNLDHCASSTRRPNLIVSDRPSISVIDSSIQCLPVMTNMITVDMRFKIRAYKTILILSIVLVLCWTPFISACLSRTVYHQPGSLFVTICLCLGYIKSAANPIIYAIRIKKFREACKGILPKRLLSCYKYRHSSDRHLKHASVYVLNDRSSISN